MVKHHQELLAVILSVLVLGACAGGAAYRQVPWELSHVVGPAQKSVVTVAAFDLDGERLKIGSGFFIHQDGTLVTNNHVLEGAYKAEIRTADGEKFLIEAVIARNPLMDLMKVRVDIPAEKVVPVQLADDAHLPVIADRVVVIGSPMGLEQTVSEGIVSAVRRLPAGGEVYQLTAPISQGSSGGPVLSLNGQVVGVVTFQAASGQNLNFAVSVKALRMMTNEASGLSRPNWPSRRPRTTRSRPPPCAVRGPSFPSKANMMRRWNFISKRPRPRLMIRIPGAGWAAATSV